LSFSCLTRHPLSSVSEPPHLRIGTWFRPVAGWKEVRDSARAEKRPVRRGFCYNHDTAEVNLARWLAWTSNPVVFTGRWARWVRFPCTSAIVVLNGLPARPHWLAFLVLPQAGAVTVDPGSITRQGAFCGNRKRRRPEYRRAVADSNDRRLSGDLCLAGAGIRCARLPRERRNARIHLLSPTALLGIATGSLSIGIAITAFSVFRQYSQTSALWFVSLAAVGFSITVVENISLMSMLSLSEACAKARAVERGLVRLLRVVVASKQLRSPVGTV
jgi:hypothetical protein